MRAIALAMSGDSMIWRWLENIRCHIYRTCGYSIGKIVFVNFDFCQIIPRPCAFSEIISFDHGIDD